MTRREVKENELAFDAMNWVRGGEFVFNMARDWTFSAYRQKTLLDVVVGLLRRDAGLANYLLQATAAWQGPEDKKGGIEFAIMVAQLDQRNYGPAGEGGETARGASGFVCPQPIVDAATRFREAKARHLQVLSFPDQCHEFLNGNATLDAAEAEVVAALMLAADGEEAIDLEDEWLRPARVAAAAALLLRGRSYLQEHDAVRTRAEVIVAKALDEAEFDDERSPYRFQMQRSFLQFAAHVVFQRWFKEGTPTNDRALLGLFFCGDDHAAQVIAHHAYRLRDALGARWWRLQYIALLWAGLSMLAPRVMDDEAVAPPYQRWKTWLLCRSLSEAAAPKSIDPLRIAERVEGFEACQWQRRYARRFIRERGRGCRVA